MLFVDTYLLLVEVEDIKGETQEGEPVIVASSDEGEVAALAF